MCGFVWTDFANCSSVMCFAKGLVCCLQGQGHNEGLYNKNMIHFIFSEIRTNSFATKITLMVHYHKLESLVKRLDFCVFVTAKIPNFNEYQFYQEDIV